MLVCLSDQSKQDDHHSPKKGLSFSAVVRRAASVASVAAKHAYAAASATRSSDEEMIPLKCCLMSISLPWEHIAHDLLLKVRSLTSANSYYTETCMPSYPVSINFSFALLLNAGKSPGELVGMQMIAIGSISYQLSSTFSTLLVDEYIKD